MTRTHELRLDRFRFLRGSSEFEVYEPRWWDLIRRASLWVARRSWSNRRVVVLKVRDRIARSTKSVFAIEVE